FFRPRGGTTMVDKVGFLITTTPGDWQDYIDAFTNVWVKKLGHSNNSIQKGPSGGAHGKDKDIKDAARDFEADSDVKVIVTAGTGAALICKAEPRSLLSMQRWGIRRSAICSQGGTGPILLAATTAKLTKRLGKSGGSVLWDTASQ